MTDGPELMYNQLRKFITVVVSPHHTFAQHKACFRMNLEIVVCSSISICPELPCLVLSQLVNPPYLNPSSVLTSYPEVMVS
jgi:hypothetical protein